MPEARPLICVVDDDASVRKSLQRLMSANGFRVETFANARCYLSRIPVQDCVCLLLDVRMPEIDGLELQAHLRERGQEVPILFLTGHGDIPMSVRAIKGGAVDFLTKPVDESALLDALNTAVVLQQRRVADDKHLVLIRERIAGLTQRELDVMRYVIAGALNKQVAAHLGIAEKTVKIHRGRVMSKLGLTTVAELIQTCQRVGVEPVTVQLSIETRNGGQ